MIPATKIIIVFPNCFQTAINIIMGRAQFSSERRATVFPPLNHEIIYGIYPTVEFKIKENIIPIAVKEHNTGM